MGFPPDSPRAPHSANRPDAPWFQRLSRPILFLIVSLMLVGSYLAFTIPVAVFPNTDFPRIVIGIDNGVMPIDQILTLQRVDAVVARLQSELPPTAKVETHRLTFATFPILGYSLTSDTLPQSKLWEIATYDLKPRVN